MDNEVLEFIGDKVLDLAVVRFLSERFGQFEKDKGPFVSETNEGTLSEIKARMVNKTALACRIDELGIAEFLQMGQGDITNGVFNQPSVKEDLFEAILGAVALDCSWDLATLQGVIEIMLAPDNYLDTEELNCVRYIQEWTEKRYNQIPLYRFEERAYTLSWYLSFDGVSQEMMTCLNDPKEMVKAREVIFWCLMKLADDLPVFRGFGKNKTEARKGACETAYKYLKKERLLPTIRDEIGSPSRNEAIGQLEILARRGYFPLPTYAFSEEQDKNGNPIWTCTCCIEEKEPIFTACSSMKKDAKKDAALSMLQFVLGEGQP